MALRPNYGKKHRIGIFKLIDATCLVTEIHQEIKKLENENRRTIIIGDHGHDEVVAIAAQVKKPIIISTIEEAKLKKNEKSWYC